VKKNPYSFPFSLFSSVESICTEGFNTLSQISISALDHTHQVIDHTEKFARRLVSIKTDLDTYTDEQRLVLKQQLLSVCRDSVEVGTEAVQGVSQLIHLMLEEAQEIQKNSDELWKDLRPEFEISNPFRTRNAVKPPTIIPISIQDN
jgi:hypothetical protein